MESFWLKLLIIAVFAAIIYRELIKSAATNSSPSRSRAGFGSFMMIGAVVGGFTYLGMSITWIETKDLRPYKPASQQQGEWVSLYDQGVIELNGMLIKTNLAPRGELSTLASSLVQGCTDDGCEAQRLFDYVTAITYKTDYTSRNAKEVIQSRWGDCDDKSNLFASLLNERKIPYVFIYVPHHVFVAVHIRNTENIPFINASLSIGNKRYYYAETTAEGAKIGEFNGQFPNSYEGIYDLTNRQEIDPADVSFRLI